MKYIVKMRNPKNGKIEAYETEAADRKDLQPGLDFWEDNAGYEIISVEEKAETPKMTFKVYINENGKAVYAGNISAPEYETAKTFVISEGIDEKDFMLIKSDE